MSRCQLGRPTRRWEDPLARAAGVGWLNGIRDSPEEVGAQVLQAPAWSVDGGQAHRPSRVRSLGMASDFSSCSCVPCRPPESAVSWGSGRRVAHHFLRTREHLTPSWLSPYGIGPSGCATPSLGFGVAAPGLQLRAIASGPVGYLGWHPHPCRVTRAAARVVVYASAALRGMGVMSGRSASAHGAERRRCDRHAKRRNVGASVQNKKKPWPPGLCLHAQSRSAGDERTS